jgi:hypothetical protein
LYESAVRWKHCQTLVLQDRERPQTPSCNTRSWMCLCLCQKVSVHIVSQENHHEGHWWSDLMAGKKKKEKKEKHRWVCVPGTVHVCARGRSSGHVTCVVGYVWPGLHVHHDTGLQQ